MITTLLCIVYIGGAAYYLNLLGKMAPYPSNLIEFCVVGLLCVAVSMLWPIAVLAGLIGGNLCSK